MRTFFREALVVSAYAAATIAATFPLARDVSGATVSPTEEISGSARTLGNRFNVWK
jgi:hypothetical protein